MKKSILLLSFLSIGMFCNAQIFKCGDRLVKQEMNKQFADFDKLVEQSFQYAKENVKKSGDEVYTIPVVVHVVYNVTAQNISDEVINDQIAVLNRDFRRMNDDASNTRNEFLPVAGDALIEFKLADTDQNGDATNGITRTQTAVETFADIDILAIFNALDSCGVDIFDPVSIEENIDCLTELLGDQDLDLDKVKRVADGGVAPWDTEKYMNIWVCNMGVSTGFGPPAPFVLGFAYPPLGAPNWEGQILPDDLASVEGVVIHFEAFGSNNPNPGALVGLNDMGRTAVHEVGHYLGLRHVWGDGDCAMDDGISDTPAAAQNAQAADANYNCSDFHMNDTCEEDNLPDMNENYMDYSPESCQNMFSVEQIGIMRAMLEGPRSGLLGDPISATSNLNIVESLMVFPNPINDKFSVKLRQGEIHSAELFDLHGRQLLVNLSGKFSTQDLKSGLYLLKVQTKDNESLFKQVIKL